MQVSIFYAASSYEEYDKTKDGQKVDIGSLEQYLTINNLPPVSEGKSKHSEFMSLIMAKQDDILIAWRGGQVEGLDTHKSSIELVEELTGEDYDIIAKSGKSIVGYSDISYLLCSLLSHGIKCFYGPNCLSTFFDSNENELQVTYKYLLKALSKDRYTVEWNSQELNPNDNIPWILSSGRCTGRVSGGNLDTICEIIKNKSLKAGIQSGDILFIEEVDPRYNYKDGALIKNDSDMFGKLRFLKECGVFDKIIGLVIGRSKYPRVFDSKRELFNDVVSNQQEQFYLQMAIKKLNLKPMPIIANVSCGHTHPMVTLQLGRNATLDVSAQTITFDGE